MPDIPTMHTRQKPLTLPEAAGYLGVTIATLRTVRWRTAKGIPSRKVWGRVLFDKQELRQWMRDTGVL